MPNTDTPSEKPENTSAVEVDAALVRRLAQLLDETGLHEIEYATDRWKVRVARHPAVTHQVVSSPTPIAPGIVEPAPTTEPASDASHPGAVLSPMVGTAFLAPEPGAASFVEVGDQVKPGQTLLIVEAMKVMNPVTAPRAGRVAKICVENGAPVEFGSALMIVE